MTRRAVERGADIVCFHEGCIPAYSWLQPLSASRLSAIAEPVPDGPSVRALMAIAAEFHIVVAAGLMEIDGDCVYNTYVVVGPDGYLARHRKLHTFINPHLAPGDR